MTATRSSVLIPSYKRPEMLSRCLRSLGAQTVPPDEVLVVWQGDDVPTRDAALALADRSPFCLRVLHSRQAGVVPAENLALDAAGGDLILLIDDDAVAPVDWVARHRGHYDDPAVGAVGGPADNFLPDGSPYPRRAVEPIGRLTWYGKELGNMYDQVPVWRGRAPQTVDHLVGYNFSLRRTAFDRFEEGLRRYWQLFEMDACLQVQARGYRVVFDFANVVEHHPTNTAYCGGRDGDLEVKIYNAAYNRALILAKHSAGYLRPLRLAYLLLVGAVNTPGVLGCVMAMKRFGRPAREIAILGRTWRAVVDGWRAGTRRRQPARID
jgi:glycosyltransferase involved in cell wall biosynthesis